MRGSLGSRSSVRVGGGTAPFARLGAWSGVFALALLTSTSPACGQQDAPEVGEQAAPAAPEGGARQEVVAELAAIDVAAGPGDGVTELGGELPPITFVVGDPTERTKWLSKEIDLEGHCGNLDGCRIALFMQDERNSQVRTITEHVYIEQNPSATAVLHGWTRQLAGGQWGGWVLNQANTRSALFTAWKWIWGLNYKHKYVYGQDGPGFIGAQRYTISFMVDPNITARVIVYDR